VELISPRPEIQEQVRRMAPRLSGVPQRRIGILSNGKANAEELARATARLFEERHGCRVVDFYDKRNAGRPCPADNLSKLSEVCEFLITTVGD
jgi:hypothetical protein